MGLARLFTCPSSATEYIVTRILEDTSFTRHYITTNRARIAEAYSFITKFLRSHSIPFYPGANAAFFIWCNLGSYARQRHIEGGTPMQDATNSISKAEDEAIMKRLLAKKVFIASGAEFGGEEHGWFRIVFTHPREYLEEGLRRMIDAMS
jgi:1-aminocyclopropane-1-carboxylate synthase